LSEEYDPSMRRRLSSLQTFFAKVIFPVVWLTMWGSGTFAMFFGRTGRPDEPSKWLFLFVGCAAAVFLYRSIVPLKAVSVDERFLYVSNYVREISIPLSQIYKVTENRWLNHHPVTIHLRLPSEFGDKIVFMPKTRFFAFWSGHPVVAELEALAGLKVRG
jgi:hypothetical protein